jgi:hypothetical protein
MSMKNSNYTIWDRTSDLQICSTVLIIIIIIIKNRKGAAAEQRDAKTICYFQKRYYKNVNARKKIEYGMD